MNVLTGKSILSRRSLLKGAGAALALPWLECMRSVGRAAATEGSKNPKRLAVLFQPNGVREDQWTPSGVGSDFRLSPTLKPLERHKRDLLVLTNLWNEGSIGGDGHYVKTSGFLTCSTISKSLGYDLNSNGVSMDQMAAQKVGSKTPLPSIELAIDPVGVGVDTNVGYTRVYGSHIAWSRPTRPLAREINPKLVFERLFRAGHPSQGDATRDRLLLDRVLADANRLRGRVGYSDRSRIDDYLESVRSLEKRVARASQENGELWRPQAEFDLEEKPIGIPGEHQEHVRLMLDMMALAFQTDTTRIATFMMGNAVSNKSFSFLEGVTGGHHSVSHHERKEENLSQYQKIAEWHVAQYAYFLDRLKNIREGDGNVLENSMILFGSGLRDGNSHNPRNLPIVVAGQAGGRIETGRHLAFDQLTPLSNLYRSMLDAFDTPVDAFADSTGLLPGVLS